MSSRPRGRERPGRVFTGQGPRQTSSVPGTGVLWQESGAVGLEGRRCPTFGGPPNQCGKLSLNTRESRICGGSSPAATESVNGLGVVEWVGPGFESQCCDASVGRNLRNCHWLNKGFQRQLRTNPRNPVASRGKRDLPDVIT